MAMQDCIVAIRETQRTVEVLEALGKSVGEPAPAFFRTAI
jgi:hypothetical protein